MRAILGITSILVVLSVAIIASLVVFESLTKEAGIDYALKAVIVLIIFGGAAMTISKLSSKKNSDS